MDMTPLQFRAVHWTTQDNIGLYFIRFSPVCILKARVLGVRCPSAAAAANARVWLCLSRAPNPHHQHLTKMDWSDRALIPNHKVSVFYCPPNLLLVVWNVWVNAGRQQFIQIGQTFRVTAVVFIIMNTAAKLPSTLMISQDSPPLYFHLNQKHAIWLKIIVVYRFYLAYHMF